MVSRWLLGVLFGALALGFVVVLATPSVAAGIAVLNKIEHGGGGIVKVHGTHSTCQYGSYDGLFGWHVGSPGNYLPCFPYTVRCPPFCVYKDFVIRKICIQCGPRLKRDIRILPGQSQILVMPEVTGKRALQLQEKQHPQPEPWKSIPGLGESVKK